MHHMKEQFRCTFYMAVLHLLDTELLQQGYKHFVQVLILE